MKNIKSNDLDNMMKNEETIDAWMIGIPATIWDGKYQSYRRWTFILPKEIIPNEKDITQWCREHKENINFYAQNAKYTDGKRQIKNPIEDIDFDAIISARPTTISGIDVVNKIKRKFNLD